MSNYVSYVVNNEACYKFSKNATKRFTKKEFTILEL